MFYINNSCKKSVGFERYSQQALQNNVYEIGIRLHNSLHCFFLLGNSYEHS
jgi:hypothetical protein